MENVSVIWILVGMATLVLGPASAAWVDVRRQVHALTSRIDTMVDQWDKDRAETQKHWERDRTEMREWLKDLETKSNETHEVVGILKDRIQR